MFYQQEPREDKKLSKSRESYCKTNIRKKILEKIFVNEYYERNIRRRKLEIPYFSI